jgi:hypothetical protein
VKKLALTLAVIAAAVAMHGGCGGDACDSFGACASGQACVPGTADADATCGPDLRVAAACTSPSDCATNACVGGACALATCGDACGADSDCETGLCASPKLTDEFAPAALLKSCAFQPCNAAADCPAGFTCAEADGSSINACYAEAAFGVVVQKPSGSGSFDVCLETMGGACNPTASLGACASHRCVMGACACSKMGAACAADADCCMGTCLTNAAGLGTCG